jgi:hypothetical protein
MMNFAHRHQLSEGLKPMLVEQRTYTTHPGKWRDYLNLYEKEGLQIQQRILGRMVGYYYSDIGELNQIVHMWAYEDLADRTRRRAELGKDTDWQVYVVKMLPLLQHQTSKILMPAPFFEPTWKPL